MIFTKTKDVKSPTRGTKNSAGLDFYVPNHGDGMFTLVPGESINIPSGIKLVIPDGCVGIFFNKSSVGIKGLLVGAQVVDSDYRGEVHLNVHNVSKEVVTFYTGQKLVQLLVMPVCLIDVDEVSNDFYENLQTTDRGSGGFGSTGKF